VDITLPDTITVGDTLELTQFVDVDLAPANVVLLFFANSPGDGMLPPGVVATIDQDADTLTVTAGAGQTIEVRVEVLGTGAVPLAEDSDTIMIVAP